MFRQLNSKTWLRPCMQKSLVNVTMTRDHFYFIVFKTPKIIKHSCRKYPAKSNTTRRKVDAPCSYWSTYDSCIKILNKESVRIIFNCRWYIHSCRLLLFNFFWTVYKHYILLTCMLQCNIFNSSKLGREEHEVQLWIQ